MKIKKTTEMDEFASLVMQGIEAWVRAGEIVARCIDEDEGWVDSVCECHPEFTPDIIRRFEQIGRKVVHPRLFISDSPGCRKLRRLAYSIQEKVISSGVDLLVKNGGQWDTIHAEVTGLTPDQAKQVFAHDHVRSEGEQRLWIENDATFKTMPQVKTGEPFTVRGKRLLVTEPCEFSLSELIKLISQMS